MTFEPEQLALPFGWPPRYEAADFIEGNANRNALTWIERGDWPDRRLAIWGAEGCGKTHLLHLWAARVGGTVLSGRAIRTPAQLPETGAFALDDAHLVTDETLLLHVLNTARDRSLLLLLSATMSPARWPVRLPDLSSRLRAINAVEILQPDDQLLRALLMRLLAERQLDVSLAVQDWLLRRLPRSFIAIRDAVERLDHVSLASGSPINRILATRVLFAGQEHEDESMTPSVSTCPTCDHP